MPSQRARRPSSSPSALTIIKTTLAVIAALTGAGLGIFGFGVAWSGKASAESVRELEVRHVDDVHDIERRVDAVYREQRTFIQYVAPELKLGRPVPPPPPAARVH
jgi:hypothetical protein